MACHMLEKRLLNTSNSKLLMPIMSKGGAVKMIIKDS